MNDALNGILVLDKPAGISSAKALDRVKRSLPGGPRSAKVGHAGTLDPFATGVLLVLIGRATKLCESLMDAPKTYETTVKFGATTETDDPESPEQAPAHVIEPVSVERVRDALPAFVGTIMQKPPIYSALKLAGKRACDRVRDGQVVELEARPIRVYAIDVLDYAWPLLKLRIDCGRGTYIRSIARDLGESLGVGGYLRELRRTRVGQFDLSRAATVERIERDGLAMHLQPMPSATSTS